MRFLIIDTYYPAFLQSVYSAHPDFVRRPYQEQWHFLMGQFFGTANFYSSNLQQIGHEATEVIVNCEPMQLQWMREHDMPLPKGIGRKKLLGLSIPWLVKEWFYPILFAQVKDYKPDVIYIQDPANIEPSFIDEIRSHKRLLVGQVASPIPPEADFSGYDLMLSSLPNFVTLFRQRGLNSELFRLGFEPRVLDKLPQGESPIPVVHIGGYGMHHSDRNVLLEWLISNGVDLDCRGYGMQNTSADSSLRSHYHGESWGLEMYRILRDSKLSLNRHIDIAGPNANNMRLYESTGVGTLLITDWKQNLGDMFEPGKEVIAYRSREECLEQIEYYLSHEEERRVIARSGQERTLREHTYFHRMQELVEILQRYL